MRACGIYIADCLPSCTRFFGVCSGCMTRCTYFHLGALSTSSRQLLYFHEHPSSWIKNMNLCSIFMIFMEFIFSKFSKRRGCIHEPTSRGYPIFAERKFEPSAAPRSGILRGVSLHRPRVRSVNEIGTFFLPTKIEYPKSVRSWTHPRYRRITGACVKCLKGC